MSIKQHAETYAVTQAGDTFKSKTAIRHALADVPGHVLFIEVGTVVNGFQDRTWTVPELTTALADGKTVVVVGPDPYRLRNYFGTAKVNRKTGKLTVA